MTYNINAPAKAIRLFSASSIVAYSEGLSNQNASVQVLVQNLAYDKQVYIHMKDATGQWRDVPLAYGGPASAGFELWKGTFINKVGTPMDPIELAAKVAMGGQTYWDNNGGANYRLRATQGTRLFGTQVLNSSGGLRSDGSFYVNIDVLAVGGAKRVQVVYALDDRASTRTADAKAQYPSYAAGGGGGVPSPNTYNVERWLVDLDATSASRITYAIAYSVDGQTSWDNNFGQKYTVTRTL